jgi:hypothetical protein
MKYTLILFSDYYIIRSHKDLILVKICTGGHFDIINAGLVNGTYIAAK